MAETDDSREQRLARQREYERKWRLANKEKVAVKARKWRLANKGKVNARNRKWVSANKEKKAPPDRSLTSKNPERQAYRSHKFRAKSRSIPFLLTFEEWWEVWQDSGKWELRGPYKGHYVMARFRDQGPYAVGNVRICTSDENNSERSVIPGAITRKRMSEAHLARWEGKKTVHG